MSYICFRGKFMNGIEQAAFAALEKKHYKIIKANMTDDTFEFVSFDGEPDLTGECHLDMEHGFRALWESYVRTGNVFHEDVADFCEYVNVDFVSEFMRRYGGSEPFEMDFRYLVGEELHPVHMMILAAEDYANDHQSIYIFLQNVGAKMREDYVRFDDLLRGLSENYEAIYYVDFDQDTIKPFRLNATIEKQFGKFFRSGPTYAAAVNSYIDRVVLEQDREEMHMVMKYEYLKEQLKHARSFTHEYRLERNGREYVYRFKIANMEGIGELHKAVLGFADVSSIHNIRFKFYKSDNKLLIVDNDQKQLDALREILSGKYEVFTAHNGKEALEILEHSYREIALVITSLRMPVMDGYELIRQMKQIRLYQNIPVVASIETGIWDAKHRDEIETVCIDTGATDVFLKPYHEKIVSNRVQSLIHLQESTNMLNTLERDSLTGLYAKEFFYRRVEKYLKENPDGDYLMWVTDIDGLKIINEKYGIDMGNEILIMQSSGGGEMEDFILGGRIEGDKLAALVKESALDIIREISQKPDVGFDFPVPNVVIRHGIYHIRKGSSLPVQGMYDRALLALQKIKDTYGVYLAEYDDVMREDLLRQRQVAENAESALKEHQFVVYYQPKYDLRGQKTSGAEALIRWIHPTLGFMNPGVFVPLFEQNGFITKLDFYVWEEVCLALKEWKDNGMRMVPISVNVSRRDFEVEDLVEKVIAIVDRYGIDHSFFHIELTESSYSDNPQQIAQTIKKFHDSGFVVELDDFGAGYSSMSALSELELDVMKLDMSIIRNDDPTSDKSVLEFSMQLAKMMKLKTVAEGVETAEQVARITSLGGDFIQGFYYSRPLPKDQFEQYLKDEDQNEVRC